MADYASLLRDRVTLTCRSIDRIFLQGYVPKLQTVPQVNWFLRWQRGFPFPSSAVFGKIGRAYEAEIERFAKENRIPVVAFEKGQNKEELARPLIEAAAAEGGDGKVVMIGTAQEKTSAWASWSKRKRKAAESPWLCWGRQSKFVKHYYFYLWDPEWGGAFIKTNAYAPFPIWLWLNGHSWAQRQLDKAGIAYEVLDNGFAWCEDPEALQRTCDRLGPGAVRSFLWRWQNRLPSPFTRADLRSGYTYELAFRQFEVSDTRVFDRPASGRAFFEGVIRDNLDMGRPSMVALIFGRRVNKATPGTFRTKVVTRGVDPQICSYYRSSRIKQYLKGFTVKFKEYRALRTELVICDTRDFGVGRRLNQQNWRALKAIGDAANQRLCDAQAASAAPAPDVATFEKVTRPSATPDGLAAPGLRFGDPRVHAVLSAILGFVHTVVGFTNAQLVELVDPLLDGLTYTSRQATYDLRRLMRKEVITRIDGTRRYLLTPFGRQVAALFTKAHIRVLAAGLAWMDPALPPDVSSRSGLAQAWRGFERALDEFIEAAMTGTPPPTPGPPPSTKSKNRPAITARRRAKGTTSRVRAA
jgi:hypothetical protein